VSQPDRMRRLNVQFPQIEECIRKSLFAIDGLPSSHPLRKGEELLLQLVKEDAVRLGKQGARIEFALIFDHVEPDPTGEFSRRHWPDAGKTWRYILHCSETVPTIPFSLEALNLSKSYAGQTNPMHIEAADEARIRPYLKGGTPPVELWSVASVDDLLTAIRNYDKVIRLAPPRHGVVREHTRRIPDTWMPDALKRLYNHRCQICVHDFEPRYGVPYADTRALSKETRSIAVSTDLAVLCPNHSAIIGAANADFDRRSLEFRYPNGLVEKLMLRDHLLHGTT
jgi:hypothetical protein